MKNIPITSRIQKSTDKGMVKKPLLNLGSPLKSTESDPKVKNKARVVNEGLVSMGGSEVGSGGTIETTGPDKIIKGKENTRNKTWGDLRAAGWSEGQITKAKEWRKNHPTEPSDQVGTGTFKPDQVIKGDTKQIDYSGTIEKPLVGDAKNPWERRWDSRAIKKTAKDVRRAEIKGAKLQAKSLGLKDKEYRDTMKSVRRGAKMNEIEAELKGFEGARDAAVRQGIESRKAGGKLDLGGEETKKYDYTREEQKEVNKNTALKKENEKRFEGAQDILSIASMSKSPFKMKGYGKKKC